MKKSRLFIRRTILFSCAFLFLNASLLTIHAAGEVDPNFKVAVQDATKGVVQKIAAQTDGKFIAAGNFTVAENSARTSIARFNADGTVDQSFIPPDFIALTGVGYRIDSIFITALAVQADGKVLIGGTLGRINNQPQKTLIRLNADGSLDSTFAAATGANEFITDIKIQSNGQIVYSGSIGVNGGGQGLTRLNPDGSTDTSLQYNRRSEVISFLIQADGKFIINDSNGIGIYRINSDGTIDNTFTVVSVFSVAVLVLQSDGKFLIGGGFTTVNGINRGRIVRLNADGSLDASFNPGGIGANATVSAISILADGKIVIGGNFSAFNGTSRAKNARLNSDGTVDTSFNYSPGGTSIINAVAATNDGGVILGGSDTSGIWNKLARLKANGSFDTSFVGGVYGVGIVNQVIRQPDGKVLIAGAFTRVNGIFRRVIARLNADGSFDTGFTPPDSSDLGYSIGLQPDGKIIVGSGTVYRLNSNGTLDSSFQAAIPNSTNILELAIQADGKIIIAGVIGVFNSPSTAVMRLNANGSTDNTFNRVTFTGESIEGRIFALRIQPDGKIVIGGKFSQLNSANRGNIARLNTDGTLDTSFNLIFGVGSPVLDLALQSNGSVIIGGEFSTVNGTSNYYYLARLLPNATLDTTFRTTPNAPVYTVAVQPDDKILIGGVFDAVAGTAHSKIARLNANGTLDNSFNPNANDVARSIYVSSDSQIYVGGDFNRINGISSVGLARLLNTTAPRRTAFDFDGDGRADVSVFRSSTGYWYTSQNPAVNYGAIQFGQSGDKLVPADYDGDGKTDVAVVRNGNWYIQRSSQGFSGTQFGDSNDVPVPADYDGDGKADIAVFRPSNGTWYLLQSTGGFSAIALGLGTDKPVPADYNGDGRAEVAVFRPSNGYWYLSTNPATGYGGIQFGASEDKPVPADYDGDGKTDLAVFRPSNGSWYLLQSTAGFTGIAFGFGTDAPVPADYDGDGKADIAVFRAGNWYLNRSSSGFTGIAFGTATDSPVPNSFVR